MRNVADYFKENDLIINLKKGKTECMLLGTAKRLSMNSKQIEVYYNNTKINNTTTYTYLGTIIDHHLNLGENFDDKVRKASRKLHLLKRLRSLMTQYAAITVYKCVILPALKYNCITHLNMTKTQKSCLKRLENRAEIILGSKVDSIEKEFHNHSNKLIKKCISGDVCNDFKLFYFKYS